MNKNVFVWVVLVVCLAFAVVGVKPANTFITTNSGLLLTASGYNAYPTNTNLELYVHVFNSSDGMSVWNRTGMSVSCYNDVYYPNGSILIEQTGTWINKELKLSLNSTGIPTGIYSYEVRCNTTRVGGEILNYFELTETGKETPQKIDNNGWLIAVILFPMILALFFMLTGFGIKDISGGLSYFFFLLSWVMLPVSYVVINLVVNEFGSYSGLMNIFDINILSIILWSMFGLIFVYLLWKVAKSFQQGKNEDFEEGKL